MRRPWARRTVVLAVVVLAASLVPASGGVSSLPRHADKLLHVAGYAAVAFAAVHAVEDTGTRALVGVVLVVAAVGAGIEVVQPTVGRMASVLDALANVAGATLGALAGRVSRSR